MAMLAIEVEFLMGRSIATQLGQRDHAEWPPHPQRLFSALVATHFELGLGDESEAALKWLEDLPAPEIQADTEPSYRAALSHWVPVNDETIKLDKNKIDFRHILERRNRQERFFPAVIPASPVVVFQWPSAEGVEKHRSALERLVQGLSYLGHSASPIRACLREEPAVPTLRPSEDGDFSLRVPGRGRFERLKGVHALRLRESSVQPPLGRTQVYSEADEISQSVFEPHALILAFDDGPRFSLDVALPLMNQLRSAVLARLGSRGPDVLTGHYSDGRATAEPHLAFIPLPFISGKHADGSLKGAALVLPRGVDETSRRMLRRAVIGDWPLNLGPLGSLTVRLIEDREPDLTSLRFASYTRPSRIWASVTPVVLDKHPKAGKLTAEEIIAQSCERIGLPRPIEVRLSSVSAFHAAPRSGDFRGNSKQTDKRLRQHVLLTFDRRVRGPVLLGAGRFLGLGVCRPFGTVGRS